MDPYSLAALPNDRFSRCPSSVMGRVKLKIKKLENTNGRQATYAKRKHGIMKKANELSILCDIDIVLLMFSPSGKPSLCCGRHSSIEEAIAKFAQVTPQERTKRKLESLGALKKAFKKLDHDVNIQEFIAKSNTTIEDLSNRARILQNRLSEIHGRLSYWTEPEKINSDEHLNQLENSIRQSLDQIHAHKENFGKQYVVQLQDTSLVKEWSNCSTHDGIQIPFEQQLQSFSWIPNNDSRNIVADEQSLIPKREMESSVSSSYGSYPVYFATGKSPEISFSEQEISFLDELNATFLLKPQTNAQQFPYIPYDFDLLNDLKRQPLPPGLNMPMNHTDYHINRILEATGSAYDATQASWGSNSVPCPVSIFDEPLFSQMQQPN